MSCRMLVSQTYCEHMLYVVVRENLSTLRQSSTPNMSYGNLTYCSCFKQQFTKGVCDLWSGIMASHKAALKQE